MSTKNSPKMSTKIHQKNVHKNSPKKRTSHGQNVRKNSPILSTKIHLLCPREVCHPIFVERLSISLEHNNFILLISYPNVSQTKYLTKRKVTLIE